MSDDGKIILFPSNRIKNNQKTGVQSKKITDEINKQKTIEFVEGAVDDIALELLHRFVDMACKTNSPQFMRDYAFLVDTLRSLLKRDFGLNHVVQKVVNNIVTIDTTPKGEQVARIDYSKIFDTETKKTKVLSDDVQDEFSDSDVEFIPDFDLPPEPENDN